MNEINARLEYRIRWKRIGCCAKSRRFAKKSTVERFAVLLGPEPWKAYGVEDPDALVCCNGGRYVCGCGGETYREQSAKLREDMPALEWYRIDSRKVGQWENVEVSEESGRRTA